MTSKMNKILVGGLSIGVATGDHYGGGVKVLDYAGFTLFNPRTGFPLTGNESKDEVPPVAYFTPRPDHDSEYVTFLPPQDFPRRMKEGAIDVAVGAGYDIQINANRKKLDLNGKLHDPETRNGVMRDQLDRLGYVPLANLRFKPVIIASVTRRDSGIYQLDDIRNGQISTTDSDPYRAISICKHIYDEYGKENKMHVIVSEAFGEIENQIVGGMAHVGGEIIESGTSLIELINELRLVRDDHGKPAIVTYSLPWVIATPDAYNKSKTFLDEFGKRIGSAVETLMDSNPIMFEELYKSFFKKYEELERKLENGTPPEEFEVIWKATLEEFRKLKSARRSHLRITQKV